MCGIQAGPQPLPTIKTLISRPPGRHWKNCTLTIDSNSILNKIIGLIPEPKATMNDTRTVDHYNQHQVSQPLSSEFEELIGKAETLLAERNGSQALGLLLDLRKKYVDSVRVFELISKALIIEGKTEAAIRHKALHDFLRAVYRVAIPDLSDAGDQGAGWQGREQHHIPAALTVGGEETVAVDPACDELPEAAESICRMGSADVHPCRPASPPTQTAATMGAEITHPLTERPSSSGERRSTEPTKGESAGLFRMVCSL